MKKSIRSIIVAFAILMCVFISWFSFAQESTLSHATLITWPEFNKKVKTLVSNTEVTSVATSDNNVKFIKRASSLQSSNYTGVSTTNSDEEIFVWFDNWTLYYYTDADIINMNQNSMQMFYAFKALKEVDLSTFDTRNVTKMKTMFFNDSALTTIYASGDLFLTDNLITTSDDGSKNMFGNATSLVWWHWTRFDSSKTDQTYARVDKVWEPWYFTEITDDSVLLPWREFNEVIKLLAKDRNIKSIKRAENLDSSFISFPISLNMCNNPVYAWYNWEEETIYYYSQSTTIYMHGDSSYMFSDLTGLTEIDFSGIDTSRVSTMQGMFNGCRGLTKLDLSTFDTSNVDNMWTMFNGCSSLTELDISHFNTSNVTTMHWMFNGCSSLTELDISHFDTSNVDDMETMFYGCKELRELDLSNFNTSNVTTMKRMFDWIVVQEPSKLTTIDLSSFDTNNVTDMEGIFNNLPNLTTIYVSNSFTTNSINNPKMFSNDLSLVWWNGTKFTDLGLIDKTYALIDSESQSWYFTDVNNITVKFINISWDNQILQKKQTVSKWGNIVELTDEEIWETQTWYWLKYYSDTGMNEKFNFNEPIMKYTEIYTQIGINQYTITFNTDWWNEIASITQDYGTDVSIPDNPTREWYMFIWWDKEIPTTMPAENMIITAKWEKLNSWWQSSGWGGHNNSKNETSWKENKDNTEESQSTDEIKNDIKTETKDDMQSVHEWSYKNWLTKYSNMRDARLWDYLTRSEMAKLSSVFAIKILGKTPDESKQDFCSQYADLLKANAEIKSYIVQSCELWYMWYQSNGINALEKFRPYSSLNLAEASVIVSRMMRWNQNATSGGKWYQWHLYATYNNWLIDDIRNPFRNITRWEAFEMFYRMNQLK